MFSSAGHMECTLQGWGSAADLPESHLCAGFLLILTRPCVISLHNVNLYVQWSVCMSSSFYNWPAKILGIKWISVTFPSPAFLIVLEEKEIYYPQLNKTIFYWGLFFFLTAVSVVRPKLHYMGREEGPLLDESPSHLTPRTLQTRLPVCILSKWKYCVNCGILTLF